MRRTFRLRGYASKSGLGHFHARCSPSDLAGLVGGDLRSGPAAKHDDFFAILPSTALYSERPIVAT
jgi:hypothetical protein